MDAAMTLSPCRPDPNHAEFEALALALFHNSTIRKEIARILTDGWQGRVSTEGRHIWITVDSESGPAEGGVCPTFDYVDDFGYVPLLFGVARHGRKNHPYPWWANGQRHDFTRHLVTALAMPVLTSTGIDHGGSECYTAFLLRFVEPATD